MRDLIDAPDLAAFAGNEGSTFTVRSAEDAELVLDDVDTRRNPHEDWERFTLCLRGPAREQVESGLHRIDHPRLDAFDMTLNPVQTLDPDPDVMHYQATFNRHVPDRAPHRPYAEEKTSRRGFFGTLAAAMGGAGLLGTLFGASSAQADPSRDATGLPESGSAYLGEIMAAAFTYAPQDWANCDGQVLPIAQNNALFSLLGTTYGGDGRTTFAIPDLRGRVPIHRGQSSNTSVRTLGETGGTEQVTLSTDQIPSHDHSPILPVSTAEGDATTPEGNTLGAQPDARGTVPIYDGSGGTGGSMTVDSNTVGGSRAHNNMPPFQTIRYCICVGGNFIYPPRS